MKYSTAQFIGDLSKRLVYGKVQKKMSLYDLKNESYRSLNKPVYILSTGRCRTHWLTSILSEYDEVYIQHQPENSFLEEGKIIYERIERASVEEKELLKQLVFTARDQMWLDCAKRGRRYIESNNRITFAAPFLIEIFDDSQFVHLTRNPIDFIKSGRNRSWYEGSSHDLGRIKMDDTSFWNSLNLNQKIGWLWLETNSFIMREAKALSSDRFYTVASEDLTSDKVRELIAFLELDRSKISKKWFNKSTNQQSNSLNIKSDEIIKDLKAANFFDEIRNMSSLLGYQI